MLKQLSRFLFVLCFFSVVTAFAVMPPQVYIEKIEESQIKALAVVRKVSVVDEQEHYIDKRVEFELLESFGEIKPGTRFCGICKSSTGTPWVGGDLYFYPVAGAEVFVTIYYYDIDNLGKGLCGEVTSYTPAESELVETLKSRGLEGIEYGMSSVRVKEAE